MQYSCHRQLARWPHCKQQKLRYPLEFRCKVTKIQILIQINLVFLSFSVCAHLIQINYRNACSAELDVLISAMSDVWNR